MKDEIREILVVDDDQSICVMLTRFLCSSGYSCESVTDPVEALEVLKRNNFQLMISDIKMADIDGLELLSEVIEFDPELDTIMMTGHTNTYTYSDIVKAGASDFIAKPFRYSEIRAKIERIDRERKMQRELQELNVAMGVVLDRVQKEKDALGAGIASNFEELVLPYLEKLKNSRLSKENSDCVEILETNLLKICSPFLKNLSLQNAHISSMEVQVANLVKAGKRNKEIASILGVSVNTVMTHRYRLRTKLGLRQKKVNLMSHLNSLDF